MSSDGVLLLRLALADLLRELVAPRLQLLRLGLYRLALVLERFERGGVESEAALGEAARGAFEVGAQVMDVEHAAFGVLLQRNTYYRGVSKILPEGP